MSQVVEQPRVDVPAGTASAFKVIMILLGIAVTPVLLSSSSIGNQISDAMLVKVVVIGAVILTLLAAINLSIGEKARLPTYGIVKFAFGQRGAIAINVLMAVSLFGWIAVTANMFGHSIQGLLGLAGVAVPLPVPVTLGCALFVGATAFGIDMLGKVAQCAVPVIAVVLAYILWHTGNAQPLAAAAGQLGGMNMGTAVSTVVGTIIVLVATLPDFGSFIRNRAHAVIAAVVTFGLVYPLLYWTGAIPSALSGEGSLLSAAAVFGAALPAAWLLLFATITGNSGNLFQGTLVVSTLLPQAVKWKISVALAVLAAIVGSMEIMNWFIPFLLFLGIATPPVAGIYIADFFLFRRGGYDERVLQRERAVKVGTFVAWLVGAVVGYLTVHGHFTVTTIPSLDSMLVASVIYVVLSRLTARRAG
jgi:purine-cytosine permease-like protein